MANFRGAVERIKALECPTGDLGYRVAGILEEYDIANNSQVSLQRDRQFDRDGAEGFCTKALNNNGESLVVIAKSGPDDYVVKVIDAYIR